MLKLGEVIIFVDELLSGLITSSTKVWLMQPLLLY